jgi:hypothetical protein
MTSFPIHRSPPARPARVRWLRRGVAMVEMALVLPMFLMLVLGMMDLGIAVYRHHLLSHAARQGVREAIVHGGLADRLVPWGPAPVAPLLADSSGHPILDSMIPTLQGLNLSEVTVSVDWPEGTNDFNKRVHVTVSTPYRPFFTWIFGGLTIPLQAESTMPIAH